MTISDVYLYSPEEIVVNEIRKAVQRALAEFDEPSALARALGWKRDAVTRLLKMEPLPELPGKVLFEISREQLRQSSYARLTRLVKAVVVEAIRDLGSNYEIADFLDLEEWDVRRLKALAAELRGGATDPSTQAPQAIL
jgi:hypothetical protein